MPVFAKHLRRLSSGITARRKSSQSDAAIDDAFPQPPPFQPVRAGTHAAGQALGRRRILTFEDEYDDDEDSPPPAYSFVEPASEHLEHLEQDVGVNAERDDEGEHVETPPLTPDSPTFLDDRVELSDGASRVSNIDTVVTTAQSSRTRHWHPDPSTFKDTLLERLPAEIWTQIASYLTAYEAASLALTTRALCFSMGPPAFAALDRRAHVDDRIALLQPMQAHLPGHLLCFECGTFHARADPGSEKLRSAVGYVRAPLTTCPRSAAAAPAVRLSVDRSLPFALAQLAMARTRLGAAHGVPATQLDRGWTPDAWAPGEAAWAHRAEFAVLAGRLLARVASTHLPAPGLTPSEQRRALLARADYTANYSTCAHEARGAALFAACRCALAHVPARPRPSALGGVVGQCAACRCLFRCALCPTEYAVEVKLVEEKTGRRRGSGGREIAAAAPGPRFRHALVVTRWTDLGACATPRDATWAACASRGTYADEATAVYRDGEALGPRRRFERASGARECAVVAVPLRRPCHWRSQKGYDLEAFVRGSDRA